MHKNKKSQRRESSGVATKPGRELQPLSVAVQIGKRIVEVRGHRTQGDFAQSIDIHKNTLGKYERGERLPDAWVILQLMEIHNVNPTWLMTGGGEPSSVGATSAAPSAPPFIPELLAALMQTVEDVLSEPALNGVEQKEKVNLALQAYGLVNTAANRSDITNLAQLRPDELRGAVELILGLRRLGAGRATAKP